MRKLLLLLWCRAVVDDVGDRAMPEHSDFRSPDQLSVLQWGSRYPFAMHTNYPGTSVSDVPLLSSPFPFSYHQILKTLSFQESKLPLTDSFHQRTLYLF